MTMATGQHSRLSNALPRWATARTDRPTYADEAANVAVGLRFAELLPWQRRVLETALEYDPDTGELAYRLVTITVPRQSGKTALELVAMVHRLTLMAQRLRPVLESLGRPDVDQRAYYTAQTGADARAKMREDWLPVIERSRLADLLVDRKLGVGTELMMFSDQPPKSAGYEWRGTLQPVATSEASGHGKVTDFGMLDEVMADSDDRREQALMPGMNTRPSPQLWVVSTMGTEDSVYLNRKVAEGRKATEAGLTHTTAYFEWSAGPEAKPGDEDGWYDYMPALGRTTPLAAIRAAYLSMDEPEFRRAYMNQLVLSNHQTIPIEDWIKCEHPKARPAIEPVVYALDGNPLRTNASLGVSDGQTVELIATYTDLDRAVEDARRASVGEMGAPGPLVIDKQSPMIDRLAELERKNVQVRPMSYDEVKAATGSMFDAIVNHTVAVVPNDALRASVEGAKRKAVGDRFVWSRKATSADLTPLNAVTFARFVAQSGPPVWSWLMN